MRSPLASSITIALSVLPEAGARGGSPLSEASILLRLPSLGGGRLSARFFLSQGAGGFFGASENFSSRPSRGGGARDVADAAQTCPPQFL